MAKIVISANVSLDGVVEDPDGTEAFRRGGWFARAGGTDLEQWAQAELAEALRTDALLLGRRSDAWFAERWLSRTGEWADRLNALPKYVVSSTVDHPRWSNATVLRGDAVDQIVQLKRELEGEIVVYASARLARTLIDNDLVDRPRWSNATVLRGDAVDQIVQLKRELEGEIVVYASARLARTLIDNDLVDEVRLVVFPVVVGAGERLFGATGEEKPMRLVGSATIGEGLVALTYEAVRAR